MKTFADLASDESLHPGLQMAIFFSVSSCGRRKKLAFWDFFYKGANLNCEDSVLMT